MKHFLHSFSIGFYLIVLTILFSSQTIRSQTWVRHLDGYSIWSIGKDFAGNIYAGTTGSNRGIFKSTDGGETWTNVFSTGTSNYLYIACDSLNNVYVANVSNGLIYSTDGGQNFTTIPASTFGGNNVNAVACGRNGHIFVGATNGGVWRSTDYGATFANTGAQTYTIVEIKVDKYNANIIYAGASSSTIGGFFISTDGGATFGSAIGSDRIWEILQPSPGNLYTATTNSPYPFSKSTDGGLTWTVVSYQPAAMRGATLDLINHIYIAGNGGVYKSTDNGATFINHNFTTSSNKILTFDYKILVCATGTTTGGVWVYADSALIPVELSGFSAVARDGKVELIWTTSTELNNSGFEVQRSTYNETFENLAFIPGFGTTTEPHSYSFIDQHVTNRNYKYRLKQIDFDGSFEYSKTVEVEVVLPFKFALEQNYPNPFNPATIIKFSTPLKTNVQLKVYDLLGNEIAELINEEMDAGTYEFNFDASDIPAGVYFYALSTGELTQTKKMILLK